MSAALEWVGGRDTGASSMAIWSHMMTGKSRGDYPYDPADFGRCYRLLCLVPEWRPRLPEMAKYGKVWTNLVARWDEITSTFERECGTTGAATYDVCFRAEDTYEIMLQCRKQAGSRV